MKKANISSLFRKIYSESDAVTKLRSTFSDLDLITALKVDEAIRAYSAQDKIKTIDLKDYVCWVLSKHINVDRIVGLTEKSKEIAQFYTNHDKEWMFGENTFCFVAYIFSLMCLSIEIVDSWFFNGFQNSTYVIDILQFLAVVLSFIIWIFIDKFYRNNTALSLMFLVFNRYMPGITMLTYLLFYCSKINGSIMWMTITILISIIFCVAILIPKCIYYKTIKKDAELYIEEMNMKEIVIGNNYRIIEEIGSGGNAKVYKVKNTSEEEYALKQLHRNARQWKNRFNPKNKEMRARFIDEITTICENHRDIKGIIPIVDFSKKDFWYTMPLAEPIVKHITTLSASPREIVEGIVEICDTLFALHDKGISHRDIKPNNIYYYSGRYYIGDFGLVDLPDGDNNLTRSDKGLGAIFTIAPEMKRDPKNADGKKADVYSLAKTLWMLLTLDETGFEGTYDFFDLKHRLREFDNLKKYHLVELEELLQDATNNTPELRPSIKDFKQRLIRWLEIENNYTESQKSEWMFLNKYILKSSGDSVSWRNRNEIIDILNKLAALPAHNHMLFSSKGGQDFVRASLAPEDGCIYISDDCSPYNIVKPKVLHFERFKDNEEWNYLLLECDELSPIISDDFDYEILVEDHPANYVSAQYAQYGVYDYDSELPLPTGYKVVARYHRGKFLFVLKSGPYNRISSSYDGRHGQCTSEQFRDYISKLIKAKNKSPNSSHTLQAKSNIKCKTLQGVLQELRSAEKYVKENYSEWLFDDNTYDVKKSNGVFYISLHINDGSLSFFDHICLCNDGHFHNKDFDDYSDIKMIYSRSEAYESLQKCTILLKQKCSDNGYDDVISYCSVNIVKRNNPTHMFTKDEIEKVMREADDRLHNTLVIDENGFAKIVQGSEISHSYPVRHSSWNAGNLYVGKYSSLGTLDDNYIMSLQGWLSYLKNGKSIMMDYIHSNCDEKSLLDEIRTFY